MILSKAWREILQHRSTADKFCIPLDCELCPVNDLPIISEMVQEGIIRWIDRQTFHARINGAPHLSFFDCDIYQLTLKGIKLCKDNRIDQR
jgi:hypothetical protein